MALAIVNEGDTIAQADKDYILSLISFYNSGLDPKATTIAGELQKSDWPLPEPQKTYLVGNIVVLKRSVQDGANLVVRGYHTQPGLMRRVIFCDFGMHDKRQYRDSIERIWKSSK